MKKGRKWKFPNVECDQPGHSPNVPGYAVCVHIADGGEPVDEIVPASETDLGQILCKDGDHTSGDSGRLICAYCAKEKGWLPPTL